MIFVYPEIDKVFNLDENNVKCIVIENQRLLYSLVSDLYNQINGNDGLSILSDNNCAIPISKYINLTTSFIPLEAYNKSIVSKIMSCMEKNAMNPDNYNNTINLLNAIEYYLDNISSDVSCDLCYSKLNISSLIKSVGIEIQDDSNDIAEKFFNYMELIQEFEGDKVFVALNFRSIIEENVFNSFLETVVAHKIKLILIENKEYPISKFEERYTVDKDLCEF